jgi:predicted nucleic acid-binding protein
VVKTAIGFADAENALVAIASSPHHVFWPLEFSFAEIRGEIRSRIAGHNQLADALLLELAMRHSAKLATFDRKISGLLLPGSAVESSVEFIPV